MTKYLYEFSAYQVRVPGTPKRTFRYNEHNRQEVLEKAGQYRDACCAKMALSTTARESRSDMGKSQGKYGSNTSHVGVIIHVINSTTAAWRARYVQNGAVKYKGFRSTKYTYEQAFKAALEFRRSHSTLDVTTTDVKVPDFWEVAKKHPGLLTTVWNPTRKEEETP